LKKININKTDYLYFKKQDDASDTNSDDEPEENSDTDSSESNTDS